MCDPVHRLSVRSVDMSTKQRSITITDAIDTTKNLQYYCQQADQAKHTGVPTLTQMSSITRKSRNFVWSSGGAKAVKEVATSERGERTTRPRASQRISKLCIVVFSYVYQ